MKLKNPALIIIFSIIAILNIFPAVAQGSFTSSGTVAFKEKGVTPPVDPETPTEPQNPPEVPSTGQEGNLTLDVVPHPYFGEYPSPTLNTVYKSKIVAGIGDAGGDAGAQTFIQVSDARPGATSGWKVMVKAGRFINSADSEKYISGAKIIFYAGSVIGHSEDNMPVSYGAELNCINNEDQNEERIFVAQPDDGIGTWVNRLYPTPWENPAIGSDNGLIQLFIPANSGAVEGNTYYSNLIWTLYNAP